MKDYQTYLFDLDGTLVFSAGLGDIRIHKGVFEMLQRLKTKGKKLGLVTVSSIAAIQQYAPDIVPFFDTIVTGDDVTSQKPDPEGIKLALANLAAAPETAVMIGDRDRDLAAAQNAHIDGMLFSPEGLPEGRDLEYIQSFHPVKILASWEELA